MSTGGKVFNFFWYGSLGIFLFNYYLYKSKEKPEDSLGYI